MASTSAKTPSTGYLVIMCVQFLADLIALAAAVAYLLHKPFPGPLWAWFMPALLILPIKYFGPKRAG